MTTHSARPSPETKPAAETKPAGGEGAGRFRNALIVLAVLAASVGVAYGAGRLQTASRIEAAEQQAQQAQQALGSAEARVLRLEARRRLHLAAVQLDERNFGVAEQHLAAAAALLGKSKPDGDLEKLRAALADAQLKASDDVAAQRAKVTGWASRFDTLVPPAAP